MDKVSNKSIHHPAVGHSREEKEKMGLVHNFLEFSRTQGPRSHILEYADLDPSDHCHSEKVFLLEAFIHIFLF